ncbi:MAG: hypothetical protein KDF60_07385 [Calditrichaeota bacterium]|nr:hypothetical protein [Calditrichota bacterium]
MKSKLLSSRNRIHLQLHDYTQKIALNNSSQKVRILYKNPDKPLLLWVDGGILDFCCSDAGKYLDHYTDIFVVAYWQPELKAFNSVNQVLKCLFNISHKLKSQFFMNKIYLLGHSFGTLFTLPAVKMYPKLYYSYLAVGQYINLLKNYQAFHKEILKNLNNKYSISAYILKKYETVTYKNLCQYDRFIRINGLLNA